MPNFGNIFRCHFLTRYLLLICLVVCCPFVALFVAEFSIRNKPVITFKSSVANEHIRILGDKAFVYRNSKELSNVIDRFMQGKVALTGVDYNMYKQFSPENVMKRFKEVFLDPIFK